MFRLSYIGCVHDIAQQTMHACAGCVRVAAAAKRVFDHCSRLPGLPGKAQPQHRSHCALD